VSDDLIHDREAIRAGWDDDDPDVTRIVRRVGAALNSGKDKAVVDVVLDETATLRREVETLRAVVGRLKAKRDSYQRFLDVAIDEENRHWLPAIIGSLDAIIEGPL